MYLKLRKKIFISGFVLLIPGCSNEGEKQAENSSRCSLSSYVTCAYKPLGLFVHISFSPYSIAPLDEKKDPEQVCIEKSRADQLNFTSFQDIICGKQKKFAYKEDVTGRKVGENNYSCKTPQGVFIVNSATLQAQYSDEVEQVVFPCTAGNTFFFKS